MAEQSENNGAWTPGPDHELMLAREEIAGLQKLIADGLCTDNGDVCALRIDSETDDFCKSYPYLTLSEGFELITTDELKALRAEADKEAATLIFPREMTPAVKSALSFLNFQTGPVAHLFRDTGEEIARKCEDEQAFVLHWLLTLALEHGDEWPKHAQAELDRRKAARGETTGKEG